MMLENVYIMLEKIGYSHPLHPTLTHVPIGLIFAAFIFTLVALVFKKQTLLISVRHCLILALISAPFAAAFGVMDWQHFYGSSWLFPIKAKIVLAALLGIVLIFSLVTVFRIDRFSGRSLVIFGVCLLLTFGLGYFGGELIYGTGRTTASAAGDNSAVMDGEAIFTKNCAMCHFTNKEETKIGPGLKGLYKKNQLPVSGWEVTDDNIRRQLRTPFAGMPAFPDQTEEEIQAIISYLQTL